MSAVLFIVSGIIFTSVISSLDRLQFIIKQGRMGNVYSYHLIRNKAIRRVVFWIVAFFAVLMIAKSL